MTQKINHVVRKNDTPRLNFGWIQHKPTEEKIGEDIDYLTLFYVVKKKFPICYLFESLALPRHQDRYYTLGFDPAIEFIAKGNTLTIKASKRVMQLLLGCDENEITINDINPYEYIQENVPLAFQSNAHQGGLIGYFSYEAANYFEAALQLEESSDFSTFRLGLYLDGLIFDSTTGLLHYYTFFDNRTREVHELVASIRLEEIPLAVDTVINHGHNFTKEEHRQMVENMLEEVRAGNTFQGEVGLKTKYTITGDKIALYNHLREVNPSPYMFYVVFGDEELLGASPEILVACTDRAILTTPTAGTIRRGASTDEDRVLARTLLGSDKDLAEHRMLVDLHRNDISRVSEVGSVKVSDHMYIIQFSHVQHIVSDITGQLAADKDSYDLLRAITPGGVVTGAPKIETMHIIAANEKEPRGPYGGAVGRFSMNGDMVFCLPIRSLFCKGTACYSQTCSGIVFDSDTASEYQEVVNKLAAMAQTINRAVCED